MIDLVSRLANIVKGRKKFVIGFDSLVFPATRDMAGLAVLDEETRTVEVDGGQTLEKYIESQRAATVIGRGNAMLGTRMAKPIASSKFQSLEEMRTVMKQLERPQHLQK